ncbi:MAG TPA: hypothetical protein VG095_08590, partial [Chthoniobacterales bacterium]|nr:hypothetical protein [Chthoniobacterales bacterium]
MKSFLIARLLGQTFRLKSHSRRTSRRAVQRQQTSCRNANSGVGLRRGALLHLGADEARKGDDHSLALGDETLGILQRELRLFDDLVQLGDEILLVHLRTVARMMRSQASKSFFARAKYLALVWS